jgi:predicted nuclease with TOPRIM domain
VNKWITIGCVVLVIVLVGGLVYAKITHSRTVDLLNESISNVKRDLEDTRGKIVDLEASNNELRSTNSALGEQLSRSSELAVELRDENLRLRNAIEASSASTGEISKLSKQAGTAIDEALAIVRSQLAEQDN